MTSMTDPVLPEIGFPTTLLVARLTALLARSFDATWQMAQPLAPRRRRPA